MFSQGKTRLKIDGEILTNSRSCTNDASVEKYNLDMKQCGYYGIGYKRAPNYGEYKSHVNKINYLVNNIHIGRHKTTQAIL